MPERVGDAVCGGKGVPFGAVAAGSARTEAAGVANGSYGNLPRVSHNASGKKIGGLTDKTTTDVPNTGG